MEEPIQESSSTTQERCYRDLHSESSSQTNQTDTPVVNVVRQLLFRRLLVGVKDGRFFVGSFHCLDKQGMDPRGVETSDWGLHEACFDALLRGVVSSFPKVLSSILSLKYLDLRFNDFEGHIPPELFNKELDAIFLNDNRFQMHIPDNLGNSPASVLVTANNKLGGCIPKSNGFPLSHQISLLQ